MKVARFASVGASLCASLVLLAVSPASAQRSPRTPATEPAPAQPAPSPASVEAHERFTRGHAAYQQGDYELAIQEWQAAYQLDARPLILYNLSQAYERGGMIAEAVDALQRYIETAPGEDPNLDTARARLASLRTRLQRTAVRIVNAPEGAEIFVDEQAWGRTPRPDPIPVSPGNHRVVLRLEGYQDFSATLSVPAGQAIDVSAEMGEAAGGGSDGPGALPFVMMGAGGGLVVVAAILGGVAMGKANGSDYSNTPGADSARGLALGADVLGAVGLAAAAGGLVWWLVTRDDDDGAEAAPASSTQARVTAAPFVGPGTVGAAAHVTF